MEGLGQERAVAVARVEQDRGIRSGALGAPRQLDPAELRHPHVNERHLRLALLDPLQRLFPISGPGDHLDPALDQKLSDRLEHSGVVVGDHARDRDLG